MKLKLTIQSRNGKIPTELYPLLLDAGLPIVNQTVDQKSNQIHLHLEAQSNLERTNIEFSNEGPQRLLNIIKGIELKGNNENSNVRSIRRKIESGNITICYNNKFVIGNFYLNERQEITIKSTKSIPSGEALIQIKELNLSEGVIKAYIDNTLINNIPMPHALLEFTANFRDKIIPASIEIQIYSDGSKTYKLKDDSDKRILKDIISCAQEALE